MCPRLLEHPVNVELLEHPMSRVDKFNENVDSHLIAFKGKIVDSHSLLLALILRAKMRTK